MFKHNKHKHNQHTLRLLTDQTFHLVRSLQKRVQISHLHLQCLNTCLAKCPNKFLIVKSRKGSLTALLVTLAWPGCAGGWPGFVAPTMGRLVSPVSTAQAAGARRSPGGVILWSADCRDCSYHSGGSQTLKSKTSSGHQ